MEYIQLSLFGKTYPEPSAATEAKTSESSSKNSSKSSNREPRYHRLIKGNGPTPTFTWETDGALLTEFSTRNIGESPKDAVASTLSSILEANAPTKYSLSAKACEGILRRAERRGKELPEMLEIALKQQIATASTEPTRQDATAQGGEAVAYAMQGFGDYKESGVASGLKARDHKDATDLVVEENPIAVDRAAFNQGQNAQYAPQFLTDGTAPTLVARGSSAVAHKTEIRYIVRRLTPTECARLQGFPDKWGHINPKEDFTDEEYSFWLEVRNTHAAINGKTTKKYTKQQMLTWYNKLHTDSAEYKMWGNGIALPTALYVMQGIAEALKK